MPAPVPVCSPQLANPDVDMSGWARNWQTADLDMSGSARDRLRVEPWRGGTGRQECALRLAFGTLRWRGFRYHDARRLVHREPFTSYRICGIMLAHELASRLRAQASAADGLNMWQPGNHGRVRRTFFAFKPMLVHRS